MTGDLFGLLTRIRLPGAEMDLRRAAQQQHLFPIVGAVVGLAAALTAILLNEFLTASYAMVSAGILLVVLYYLTGILHTEGLADFADGLMASGTSERKREAMKDVHSGVAAVIGVTLYLILFFAAATRVSAHAQDLLTPFPLLWAVPAAIGLVLSEMAGKLAMNVTMFLGPSSHSGMGTLFVSEATASKLVLACAIAGVIGFVVAGYLAIIVYLGLLAGLAVTVKARGNFGGVSGDVFGAANEVGRLLTLVVWVLFI